MDSLHRKFGLAAAIVLLYAGALADSEDVPRLQGVRIARTPTIDGVLAEGEWAALAHASGFIDPYTETNPVADTEIWLGYDDEAIYVAFFARDSQPDRIVAREIQPGAVSGVGGGRGGSTVREDVLEFSINPFNTRQGGMSEFRVNALGTTSENIAGGRSAKREFRGEWTAAARIVEGGWVAEMRIPWAILNIPSGEDMDMDINFARGHARTQVNSYWANRTLRRLSDLVGIWETVTPPAQSSEQKLRLLGYIAPEFDEDADDEFAIRGGLDARYEFNSQMTGLLSVSPDFRNIEQQVTGISFTRTVRFERDSRPFFTEGSSFFGGGRGGGFSDQLFNSRAIEDFDQGAKFYGNLDAKNSVGILVTREDGRRVDAVLNFRHLLGNRSRVGFFASASSDTGLRNYVYQANATIARGNYNIRGSYGVSETNGVSDTSGSANLSYNIPKFSTSLTYSWVDPDFDPALGFIRFTNRRGASFFTNYNTEYRTGPLRSFSVFLFGQDFKKFDGDNQQKGASLNISGTLRSDIRLSISGQTERFEDEEEKTVSIGADFNVSNRFRSFGFDYNFGERAGERTEFVSIKGNYRFPGSIDVGLRHSFLDFNGRTEQTIVTLGWEIDARQSLTGRFVSRDGTNNYFVSYSSSGFTGMDWFVIIGDPNADEWRSRVTVKFVWAR
ncbi:MAG: hypothetical protein IH944_12580 [Armatimonadetes bacterium]|nr:hypothetical protein [Armatimonadota bacterium]